MPSSPAPPLAAAALLLIAGCNGIEGGGIDAAKAACDVLCGIQERGEGCSLPADDCHDRCVEDAIGSTERCLAAAQAYYTCAAEVIWACPVAPGHPETEDARCAAEEHAWLVCKVTGELPPE